MKLKLGTSILDFVMRHWFIPPSHPSFFSPGRSQVLPKHGAFEEPPYPAVESTFLIGTVITVLSDIFVGALAIAVGPMGLSALQLALEVPAHLLTVLLCLNNG